MRHRAAGEEEGVTITEKQELDELWEAITALRQGFPEQMKKVDGWIAALMGQVSLKCSRIAELEAENARLKRELDWSVTET